MALSTTTDIDTDRKLELLSQQDARERLLQRIRDQHEFPSELETWLDYDLEKIDEFLDVLRAIRDGMHTSYAKIGDHCDKSGSTVGNYSPGATNRSRASLPSAATSTS